MTQHLDLSALGRSSVSDDELEAIVAAALDTPSATVVSARVEPVDYPIGTIATAALLRVVGTARDALGDVRPWRVFAKELQSARVWPLLHTLPEEARAFFVASFPWRLEIDAFATPFGEYLPPGLRTPRLLAVREIDADRATIFMEDIEADTSPWSDDRFSRAARLLGELAGNRPLGTPHVFCADPVMRVPGLALQQYSQGRVGQGAIPAVVNPDAWAAHPLFDDILGAAGSAALRSRLCAHVAHIPVLLDRLDALPQTYAHGDASPHNLLVPVDGSADFVVIDWGFNTPLAAGFDLGQLLIGMVNDDTIDAHRLPDLEPLVLSAYAEGLRASGFEATADEVRRGFVMSTVVRDLYTALEVDLPPGEPTPARRAHVANRIMLTEYLLGLADEAVQWVG